MELLKNKNIGKYVFSRVFIVLGIVLVWRGICYILDKVDMWLFGGSHFWTSVLGLLVGLAILYLPDKDLKEIEKV
jgi:uncharacterized membrane protein